MRPNQPVQKLCKNTNLWLQHSFFICTKQNNGSVMLTLPTLLLAPRRSWNDPHYVLARFKQNGETKYAKEVLDVTAVEAINKARALPPLVLGLRQLPELQIRSPFNPTLHFLEEKFWHREFWEFAEGFENVNGCISSRKHAVFLLRFINKASAVGVSMAAAALLHREDVATWKKGDRKVIRPAFFAVSKPVPCSVS